MMKSNFPKSVVRGCIATWLICFSTVGLTEPTTTPTSLDSQPATTESSESAQPQSSSQSTRSELAPFHLTYSANYEGLPFGGTATRTLTIDRDSGQYSLLTKANSFLMKLREQSTFTWDAANCKATPTHYSYKRSGVGKNKKRNIQFDHQNSKATFTYKDETTTYDITEKTADRLTEQLVVRCLVQRGEQAITVQVARKNELVTHDFKVIGEESIETPIGKLETIKVERIHANPKRQTLLWFAKSHDHLLVKLEQIDDGKHYAIQLESID